MCASQTAVFVVFVVVLAYQPCSSRSLPEDSVVSVYTTQPTTAGTHPPFDVYHQIANNIAERITSPIYRFLGIGKNKTEDTKTSRRTWEKIELLDEIPEDTTKPNYLPVDNEISENRDVEELSVEALQKTNRKPEKIVLYSSYLPVLGNLEIFDNDNNTVSNAGNKTGDDETSSDDDDGLTLDDVDEETPRDGYFISFLEMIGSIWQLIMGGLSALFKPKSSD